MRILLVDVSAIAHPAWHVTADDPNPNAMSEAIVSRVRSLAGDHDRVAVCVERGKSFRCEISEAYKAHRESKPAAFYFQYDRAVEVLEKDGYLVLGYPMFEADDIVATATAWLRAQTPPHEVTFASSDKDLSCLIGDGVAMYSLTSNTLRNADGVREKWHVEPSQMPDFLALTGDSSDNIAGAKGVGPVKAADLLKRFGSLVGIYSAVEGKTPEESGIKPALHAALKEHALTVNLARKLVTLRTDAPIDCAAILTEREQKPLVPVEDEPMTDEQTPESVTDEAPEMAGEPVPPAPMPPAKVEAAPIQTTALAVALVEWERSLEPMNSEQCKSLSARLFNSRMLSGYGNPDAVLGAILLGRELGLGAMSSLRGIHCVEGRYALSADMMVALVLRSPECEYFEPAELTDTKATYRAKKRGRPELVMSFDISEAERAGLVKDKSGWKKWPLDMCAARCAARLARKLFPKECLGLYVPEELES
jgi:5'-3' exonuclease